MMLTKILLINIIISGCISYILKKMYEYTRSNLIPNLAIIIFVTLVLNIFSSIITLIWIY